MFKRVYGHCLEENKNWYAYNASLSGYQRNRRPEASKTFQCFPSEVRRVNQQDLRDDNGRPVSYRYFFCGVKKNVKDVYVISTPGMVVLSLRHGVEGWLNTDMGRHIGGVINSVLLKNLTTGAKSKGCSGEENETLARAEGHISLLNAKIAEQQVLIKKLEAHCEVVKSVSGRNSQLRQTTTSPCTTELSTSALFSSNEITPPEMKRCIQAKRTSFHCCLTANS